MFIVKSADGKLEQSFTERHDFISYVTRTYPDVDPKSLATATEYQHNNKSESDDTTPSSDDR